MEQFCDFVAQHHHPIDHEDQNREIFLILDRTCKGFLTLEDFIRGFERIGTKLKVETIENAFKFVKMI